MRPELPTGTVTLLFTDVEGSTKLLHELGTDRYAQALDEHRRVIREACVDHAGVEVDTQGDAFFFAFPTATGALAAAGALTRRLASEGPIRVRVGLHTGKPLLAREGYVGDDVHLGARVAAAGHGGQVVLTSTVAELVDLPLTDLGEHRLKDIRGPVAIFQLGEESFPPLKTISNTNLPRPASSFVGRKAELEEVLSRLGEGARLLTLTGPGGTGKTRLALETASNLVPEYKAGVFWVGLASLRDSTLVTETIAQTLGAKGGLAEHIGERQLLLFLDNLEQVIECAPELAFLLETCPNLTILATSRELLRLRGEVAYPVHPLAEAEAVSLFCERSGLEPSSEISELCSRLDSLPLAVELAAARTTALSPAQILERLSSRLDLLRGGRDADPRHETLRATIEWSYSLLSGDEQRLFRGLSVFAGCTLEASEEVGNADVDTLQSLVEKSLCRFTSSGVSGRYWMLETIREYARERLLEADTADELRRRHLEYFLRLAEDAESELWAQQSPVRLEQLDPEQANLRIALDYALAERPEAALRLAGALYPFWEIRAQHREARSWLTDALAVSDTAHPEARAKALVGAGRASAWQSDRSAAIDLLEEAVALSRRLGDDEAIGRCLGFIGHALLFSGDSEQAALALDEAVALARNTGDRRSLARALYNAAFAPIELRDFGRARALFAESADLARGQGMPLVHALSVLHDGYTATLAGDLVSAARRLDEAVGLLGSLGKTMWPFLAQRYRAVLALFGGEIDEAESLLRTSLSDGREEAPQQELPYWIEDLAAVASAKGEDRRAAILWSATDRLFETRGLVVREENRQVRERFRVQPNQAESSAEAWEQGRLFTLDEAIDFALTVEANAAVRLN